MTTILVVDDHENIRNLIEIYLKKESFNVLHSTNGEEALDVLEKNKVDLIIADVMMPKMDGYTLVDELRQSAFELPILMITAKDTFEDLKTGFEVGVDDYMSKPVDMDEMILRVKALLRRAKISADPSITIGDVVLDYEALEVRRDKEVLHLPKKEFYLLYKLLSYPNKIFTRQELMDDIWGYDSDVDCRTVDVHVKRLRDRFETYEQFDIKTVRGLGYKGVFSQ